MVIGYTAGVFDLFHIGHLTLLKNAKGLCDKLIVGVTVDELVTYKGKNPMIPFSDRIEIIRNIKCVDAAVPQYDMDKLTMCKKLGATILFVGDDWYGTEKWQEYERKFAEALDSADEVEVYAKLPRGFYIPTPVGNYSPDWAIAFKEGTVQHIYFVAETKGTNSSLEIKPIEKAKIQCAGKLFAKLSGGEVRYGQVKDYGSLMNIVI